MRAFAVILLILAPAGIARAETFYADIGGREVYMEVPDGYCVMMGEDEGERRLMDFLAAAIPDNVTFEIAFADCGQLGNWKAGRRATLGRFGYITSMTDPGAMEFPGDQGDFNRVLENTLGQMSESDFGRFLGDSPTRAQAILDEMEMGVRVDQIVSLGYLGHDSGGTYQGMIQKLSNDDGHKKTTVGIYSMITVQNRILFFYLWDVYSGDVREIDALLAKTKRFSRLQHQVN